jgi:predicted phosphodiesterase
MKTLVISDLHLTNDFDHKKYNYLKNLILKYDRVVINGDLWSYYSCTIEEFINSPWKKLFPILKDKEAVYIFGNHDRKEWNKNFTQVFSKISKDQYKLEDTKKTFLIIHGHTLTYDSIQNEKFISFIRKIKFDKFVRRPVEQIIVKHLKFILKLSATRALSKANPSKYLRGNNFLVLGHFHYPLTWGDNLIVTGQVDFGLASYLEIVNGIPKLITEKY